MTTELSYIPIGRGKSVFCNRMTLGILIILEQALCSEIAEQHILDIAFVHWEDLSLILV